MQLSCTNCGEKISSENINIQRMVAVCSHCDTVFQFDPSDTKIKRRKIKPPQHLTLEEAENQVQIAFRTNFLLGRNENFFGAALISAAFTFITALLGYKAVLNPTLIPMVVGLGLVALSAYYWLALIAFNKTHIEIGDERIVVSRRPLPDLSNPPIELSLSGIEKFRYEETVTSKKQGYDTPRYNVWAEAVDGHRKLVVSDVVEDYAVFISQRLNEFLDSLTPQDLSCLQENEAENGQILAENTGRSESAHI